MLPTFIIIGGMKCGTSSLYNYLSVHPEIQMSDPKELSFFILEKNYAKGLDWYRSFFKGEARAHGEASTDYTKYPTYAGVPERMYSLLPDVKLIYLVRNPIERIASQYVHFICEPESIYTEKRGISTIISNLDRNPYIYVSKYFMQINRYLEFFPRKNILVVLAEDLLDNRAAALQRIFEFLNIDTSFSHPSYSVIHNTSSQRINDILKKNKVNFPEHITAQFSNTDGTFSFPDDLKERILDYLKEDMASLKKLTGYSLKSWGL